jgi:amidase
MAPSRKMKPKRPWQEIAREAQEYRDASLATFATDVPAALETIKNSKIIPMELLQVEDLTITVFRPEELVKLLANRELTATEVTTAFLRRATLAQKLVSTSVFS